MWHEFKRIVKTINTVQITHWDLTSALLFNSSSGAECRTHLFMLQIMKCLWLKNNLTWPGGAETGWHWAELCYMWRSAYFGLLRSTSISGSHTDLWPLQPYLKHTAVGLCNKNTGHKVRSLTTQHILCCANKHFKNTFVWWYSLTDDSFVHDTILSQVFF